MAHVFKGYLYALSTDREGLDVARTIHATVGGAVDAREAGHVAALGHLTASNWNAAGRTLAALTEEHPLDALALGGAPDRLFHRQCADVAGSHWPSCLPGQIDAGFHALLGMQAFGFEEMGDYTRRPSVLAAGRPNWSRATAGRSMRWRM